MSTCKRNQDVNTWLKEGKQTSFSVSTLSLALPSWPFFLLSFFYSFVLLDLNNFLLKLWKALIYWHSAILTSFQVSWPLDTLNSTHPWLTSFPLLSPFSSVVSSWILWWSSQTPSSSSNCHSPSLLDTVHQLPMPAFLIVLILLYSPVHISGAYRQSYE